MFKELFSAFEEQGESLYMVGGVVRDLSLARIDDDLYFCNKKLDPTLPNRFALREEYFWEDVRSGKIDVDFATSALPDKIIQILKSKSLPVIPIGIAFGTVQTYVDNKKVEITTFRCEESYKKGDRKPSVIFGKTLEEDLARRDFTINAMAMDKDGKIIDPFEGLSALVLGLLHTPQDNPEISFSDDPLRMLRAFRFEGRGYGLLGRSEFEAIEKLKKEINTVSSERIFEEMSKILMSPRAEVALEHMAESGLLGVIFPELQVVIDFKQNQGKWHSKQVWPHTLQVVKNAPQILEVKWAALFHDVAKPQTYTEGPEGVHFYQHDWKGALMWDQVADRLRTSNEFKRHVSTLIYEHLQPSLLSTDGVDHASDKALRRMIVRLGDKLDNLFHLSVADITSHKPSVVAQKKANCLALQDRCKKLNEEQLVTKIKLPTGTGNVIGEALNIKPGKELGQVMKKLEQMLIDGELTLESNFAEEAKRIFEKSNA